MALKTWVFHSVLQVELSVSPSSAIAGYLVTCELEITMPVRGIRFLSSGPKCFLLHILPPVFRFYSFYFLINLLSAYDTPNKFLHSRCKPRLQCSNQQVYFFCACGYYLFRQPNWFKKLRKLLSYKGGQLWISGILYVWKLLTGNQMNDVKKLMEINRIFNWPGERNTLIN